MLAEAIHSGQMALIGGRMNRFVKRRIRITAALAAVIVVCLTAVFIYLVYPGTPSKSKVMKFEGYIELPRGGLLNVLDYLTLNDSSLFVTNESSGALFKVALDLNHLSLSSVSEMPGGGAVHGVALLDHNVAFITRSEENTVDVFDPNSLQQLGRIPVADDADAILLRSVNQTHLCSERRREACYFDRSRETCDGRNHTSSRKAGIPCFGLEVWIALSKS